MSTRAGHFSSDKFFPTLKLKLPRRDKQFTCLVFDNNKEQVEDLETVVGKGAMVQGLIKCTGVWFAGGKFGVSMGKGAIADFQVFDEETGRFVDMVNTHAPTLQNPLFDYLNWQLFCTSSQSSDCRFGQAQLKDKNLALRAAACN